jgi:hypothetical protein
MFDLNPLDVLKQRELSYIPPHFSKMDIQNVYFDSSIKDWIKSKLKGRFCLIKMPAVDSRDKLSSTTFVAFEDEKELTFFMLACPFLRR